MKSSTHDRWEGAVREAKGVAKQAAGKASGDTTKQVEGAIDRAEGKAQKAGGELKRKLGH